MTRPEPIKPILYRVDEVASLLGLGKSKTYLLISSGAIPSIRLGKSVRVPAAKLDSWLKELIELEGNRVAQ